jgi:hypothetical protein
MFKPRIFAKAGNGFIMVLQRRISIQETRRREELRARKEIPKKVQFEKMEQTELMDERNITSLRIGIKKGDAAQSLIHYRNLKQDIDKLSTQDALNFLELIIGYSKMNVDLQLVKDVEQLVRCLTLRGIVPNSKVFYCLFISYLRLQSGRLMESLMEFMILHHVPVNEMMLQLLLSHYAKSGPAASASKLIDYILDSGLPTTPKHYHLLIDSYGKSGKPWEAMQVISQAESQGHDVDSSMLTRLLHAFATNGEIRGMNNVWNIINSKNLNKTTEMHNILIDGYKKHGNYQKGSF